MSRSTITEIANGGLVVSLNNWAPSGSNVTTDSFVLHSPYVGYFLNYTQGSETQITIQIQGSPGGGNFFGASESGSITLVKLGGNDITADEKHTSVLSLGANGTWAPFCAPHARLRILTTGNTNGTSELKLFIAQGLFG